MAGFFLSLTKYPFCYFCSKSEIMQIISILILLFRLQPTPEIFLPQVKFETNFGEIVLEVDTVRAPVTATNFLGHVEMR